MTNCPLKFHKTLEAIDLELLNLLDASSQTALCTLLPALRANVAAARRLWGSHYFNSFFYHLFAFTSGRQYKRNTYHLCLKIVSDDYPPKPPKDYFKVSSYRSIGRISCWEAVPEGVRLKLCHWGQSGAAKTVRHHLIVNIADLVAVAQQIFYCMSQLPSQDPGDIQKIFDSVRDNEDVMARTAPTRWQLCPRAQQARSRGKLVVLIVMQHLKAVQLDVLKPLMDTMPVNITW